MWKCDNCGHPNTSPTESSRGGDGFNDRCCGVEDFPIEVMCEVCTARYLDGDLIDRPRQSRWLTKKDKKMAHRTFHLTHLTTIPYHLRMIHRWRSHLSFWTEQNKHQPRFVNDIQRTRRILARHVYICELILREEKYS